MGTGRVKSNSMPVGQESRPRKYVVKDQLDAIDALFVNMKSDQDVQEQQHVV